MRIGLFLLIVNLSTAQHRLVHNQMQNYTHNIAEYQTELRIDQLISRSI